MRRYLTPARVGLLVLIELYCEGAVPSDAILPVLSFVSSHLIENTAKQPSFDSSARWSRAEKIVSIVVSIKDFENLLSSYSVLVGMPGRKLWDQFLDRLWSINTLDTFHSFVDTLPRLIAKTMPELRGQSAEEVADRACVTKISRFSLFGTFIRRARLELSRLRWNDTAELWKDFVAYRQPTSLYLRRKNPTFPKFGFDGVLLQGEQEDWSPDGASALASVLYGDIFTGGHANLLPVSTNDIEALLEFQIEQMQKYGCRIPHEVRNQFHDLLNDSFLVPSLTHYLKYALNCCFCGPELISENLSFLDAWKAGDLTTSFDYLHRYFDYALQNRDRLFYQYALMNLAVLQADFGCYGEAVAAMLETVSTARENRDMTCLNFALNWLFHFGRAHPDLVRDLRAKSLLGTGKENISYLRYRARETGMWALWSSALLSEAKLCLVKGDSIATTSELIVRSSQTIIEKNLQNMFGTQLSLAYVVWERLGVIQTSIMATEVFLRCHAPWSVFDDELKFVCRLAMVSAANGQYDEALQRLERLEPNCLRTSKSAEYLVKQKGVITLARDLHQNKLDGAEQILDQLLQSKADDLEPEMALVVENLLLDCLVRRGDLQAAYTKMAEMEANMREGTRDVHTKARLLLWKAYLLDKSGRPQRGFSVAMRAANVAWRARLMPCFWQALGAISNVLVSLDEFDFTVRLLTSIIPRAIECESSSLVGQLYTYLADAYMGLAGLTELQSPKRTEYMTAALEAAGKAFDYYSSLEDINRQCELMAKKAMMMKLSGDYELAASYAAAYARLRTIPSSP